MNQNLIIAVIDGQGGGIGRQVVEKLSQRLLVLNQEITIRALGTNSSATSQMLRAGANEGATGENAIIWNAKKADIIVGVMGIVIPNSILGELTLAMAEAISNSDAQKILIPIQKCRFTIALPAENSLCDYIDKAVELVMEEINKKLL